MNTYIREFCRDAKALNYQRYKVSYFNGSRACFKIFSSLKDAKNFYKTKLKDAYIDDLLLNLTIISK